MPRLRSMPPLAALALAMMLGGCISHPVHHDELLAYQFTDGKFTSYHGVAYNGYGGGWYR